MTGSVAWIRFGVIAGFVLTLEFVCRIGWVDARTMIAPSEMALSLARIMTDGEIYASLSMTVFTILAAYAISVVLGTALGLLIQRYDVLRRATAPILAAWYAIPSFAFYPLFIVLLGFGRPALVALGVKLAIVSMIAATIDGLDKERRVFSKVARVAQLGGLARIRFITLPAALPHLMTGLKLAFVYSFIGVVAGEFILSTAGLGYEIAYAYDNYDTTRMYGLILLTCVIAALINSCFRFYERRLPGGGVR